MLSRTVLVPSCSSGHGARPGQGSDAPLDDRWGAGLSISFGTRSATRSPVLQMLGRGAHAIPWDAMGRHGMPCHAKAPGTRCSGAHPGLARRGPLPWPRVVRGSASREFSDDR